MKIDMNNVTIREARQEDLETLYKFEQGVISAERPYDPTLKADPINYYDFNALFHSADAQLVVAEYGKELIASGYARIEKSKAYTAFDEYAYLGFMFVVPEFRGLGINTLIIAALAKWAAARKVYELRLEVYYENEPAIRAYEKLGFSKHMIEMRLEIGQEGI